MGGGRRENMTNYQLLCPQTCCIVSPHLDDPANTVNVFLTIVNLTVSTLQQKLCVTTILGFYQGHDQISAHINRVWLFKTFIYLSMEMAAIFVHPEDDHKIKPKE